MLEAKSASSCIRSLRVGAGSIELTSLGATLVHDNSMLAGPTMTSQKDTCTIEQPLDGPPSLASLADSCDKEGHIHELFGQAIHNIKSNQAPLMKTPSVATRHLLRAKINAEDDEDPLLAKRPGWS